MEGSAPQAAFYYQNNIAALKIIECLFFNTDIKHIRLENYEEGPHIDDIIIYKNTKTEYIQVKWSKSEKNSYTLYNLLKSKTPKKSIFRQLAEGYLSVKKNNIDFSIILFTTKRESSQKQTNKGLKHDLAEIRTKVFEPLRQSNVHYQMLPNYKEYSDTIEKIRKECQLDKNSFNDFIKKLEFKFSQKPTDQIQNAIKSRLRKLGIETSLFEKILDGVVNWSITGEQINKETLLRQLGITNRFQDKLSHHFKVVDDKYYVPNSDLLLKLKTATSELNGGYIFIEGLPGIGKSTALSKFKEKNPEITLAYYCFIPEAKNNFGELRHKAYYFLKSLCISIENQFSHIDLPNMYSENFEEKLNSYIDKLGTLKKKIIFIIDGLDHVDRDTTLNKNSLLHQIKGNLPDSIFFILSSQYKTVLSPSVEVQINTDQRRHIVVNNFTQREIRQYLNNKEIDAIDFLDKIEKLSGGIPLYLHYISEILIKTEKRDYESIIKDLPRLIDGKINSYHEYLFQKIGNDAFCKWVLAVLANRKEYSTPETICEILKLAGEQKTVTDVLDVINNFSHILKQKDGRAYSIFHNSFREFILNKTESIKKKLNTALVLYYEKNPYSDDAYRNYFKHLNEIGEYDKIVSLTTLDWIKSAWQNFRPLKEIKENLEIALNSCVETLSLSEFIRIAFLKAQFLKLSHNFEYPEIDLPLLLLNAGETANSLRLIWDGDFVLTDKESFAKYSGNYYKVTGNLLPNNIIQQGFSKSIKKGNSDTIATVQKSRSLFTENLKTIFEYIDTILWQKSEIPQVGYLKESISHQENNKANFAIKLQVIDYLFEYKKFNKLYALLKVFKSNKKLLTKTQIALLKLLILSDKKAAFKLISEIDWALISDKSYFSIISYCSNYLTNEEVVKQFLYRDLIQITLHEKVIQTQIIGLNFGIHPEIISLFDDLKSIWIFKPEMVNQLLLKVTTLPSPSKNIYNSIFYLSELWNKSRDLNLTENAKVNLAKKALKALYVPRRNEFHLTNNSLFDNDSNTYSISNSINHLFNNIFNLSCQVLSSDKIIELANYWFELEKSEDGYIHYTIALGIANEIHSSQHNRLTELLHKIIKYSEKIARHEEETGPLLNEIIEVAEAYGICGFKDDFKRIYDQLVEIAFGLDDRKDYQTSYITSSLEFLHKTEPEGTLKRLNEILTIQNKLADVGRSRMHHICLSDLISFTAKHFPELAFEMLAKEENNLWREESIERVFTSLIKNAAKEKLPLLFSVVKTIHRWKKDGIRDNFFLIISLQLLNRAIEINDKSFITNLLDLIKQNTLVELESLEELEKFSQVFINAQKNHTIHSLPEPSKKDEESINENRLPQGEKFATPALSYLIEIFERDYLQFEKNIQSKYEICLKNRRSQTFRNEYYRSKSTFEKFYATLPKPIQLKSKKKSYVVIRNYLELKNKILDLNSSKFLKSAELKEFFDIFVTKTNALFPDNALQKFIAKDFEKDKWIENILRFINEHRSYVFSNVISEENLLKIIQEVSILHSDNLLTFINKRASGKTRSSAKLIIANRLIAIDPAMAKKILSEVAEDGSLGLLFSSKNDSNKLGFDFVNTIFKIDKEFGKKFLLKSYISQYGEYGNSLIARLDELVKYREHFEDKNVVEIYYESNLQYNRELSFGLPEKKGSYDYILEHKETLSFAEITIKYLVKFFNHPVVKIRELTLQSVFDLVIENEEYLKEVFKYGVTNGSNNQIEHCLVVFQAISIKNPKMLLRFKKELISLKNKEHFNILESLKELLLRLNDFDNSFLSDNEVSSIYQLNTPSPILFNNIIINSKRGKKFIYSLFLSELITQMRYNEVDNSEIQDDIFTDLVAKGLGDYNADIEGSVHRSYDINTNFDKIEIQSPYYDEMKCSINKIFHSKIKRNCFKEEFVNSIKSKFRIYDPSKLLYKIKLKPNYINWLPKDISETDFIEFNDFNNLVHTLVNREPEFLTLVEWGSQRLGDNQSTCYFEVFSYLQNKGFDDSILNKEQRKVLPIIGRENSYAYETPSKQYTSKSFPIKEIKPLIEFSLINFSDEPDLINANLLSDVFEDLGIEKANLLEIMTIKKDYPVNAFRWQNHYTQFGRRRYKPTSEGFTLKINKEILLNYLSENNLVLCYYISLKRSITKDRPEEDMDWHYLKRHIKVNL